MEWVLLVTLVAPAALSSRSWVESKPKIGLTIWFTSFLSAGLATLSAILISVLVAFRAWFTMNSQPLGSKNWLIALGISFLPWIFLALGGIGLALVNHRLSPLFESAREIHDGLGNVLTPSNWFAGYPVACVELPVKFAFTGRFNGKQVIVISRGVLSALTQEEIEAVLWHEVGHIKGGHNALKKVASLTYSLAPFIKASAIFVAQVEVLCEIEADLFALTKVRQEVLNSAHRSFGF